MTYHSVIRNFANIGLPQAQKLKEVLSLSMSPEMLKFCGAYYRNRAKRDPFVDEIKLLDMLMSTRENSGSFVALTEFLTNDAFVARTYADLLKKRKQLYPSLTRPCTLGESANLATSYIRRARGESLATRFVPSIENIRDGITYPDANCIAAPNSAFRLRLLPFTHTAIADADTLILISPAKDDTQSVFRRKMATLLRDKELLQYVKGVSVIGRGGILEELLNITDGVLIQLSALSPIGTSVPVTTLCEGFEGCRILRVAPQYWNVVTALLSKGGVKATPFASIRQEPQFVFVRDRRSSFALDAHFLRTLNHYHGACAKLTDESALTPDTISFGGIGAGKCAYLTPEVAMQIGEVTTVDSIACVAASATPANTPYKTALWSVLATAAALCTQGTPFVEQSLSIALEIPEELTDSAILGKCMSTVLGIYRAQTELGLAATGGVTIRTTKNLLNPSVSVWTTAQSTQKVANTLTKSGNFVYAVSPKLDQDGLPDFSALRQMLVQIAKLVNEGKILSARTLVGEAVTDGIRKMSDTHTCVLSNKGIAAEGKLPLCILIESEEDLPLCFVGKVHPYNRPASETVEIRERTDIVACERPDIVIVSNLLDSNAMALAAFLEERGAHVSLFAEPEKDAVSLSRAILTTQTLILCSDVKLPETKQMAFALDSCRRAGGIFLSLSKTAAYEGFIPLKNGIDAEILKKICN